jgi:hypothetical protein
LVRSVLTWSLSAEVFVAIVVRREVNSDDGLGEPVMLCSPRAERKIAESGLDLPGANGHREVHEAAVDRGVV